MPNNLVPPGRYVEELPTSLPISTAPTSVAAFIGEAPHGPVHYPVTVTNQADLMTTFGATPASGLGAAVEAFFVNGGSTAVVVRVEDGSRAAGVELGLRTLDAVDDVNLLVLSPSTPEGQVPDAAWAAALRYGHARGTFLIVDPPPGLSAAKVRGWADVVGLTGTAAVDAALYFPRLLRAGAGGAAPVAVAASGAVAGVYVRTDVQRGVWRAPAGTDARVVGTVGPEVRLTDGQSGELNRQGINVIRALPGHGTVVWGSRTLRGADGFADEYKYVPVRRLALHLHNSITRGIRWTAFEQNGEALWARLRLHVGTFLHDLFRRGAFQGTTPREAYFVACDASTTFPVDIASGIVNIVVGFAPLKPAEFVVLHFRAQTLPPVEPIDWV